MTFIQTIYEICELVQGPVSAETVSQTTEGMVREGRLLAQIHGHVVVKSIDQKGIAATKIFYLMRELKPMSLFVFKHLKPCWLPKLVLHIFLPSWVDWMIFLNMGLI